MNILDENILNDQKQLLKMSKIGIHQIGDDLGWKGMQDEEIIPLLHGLNRPTFFSRDSDFFHRTLCHPKYCLVYLDIGRYEVASFVRRLLRHQRFDTHAKRMGTVIRVFHGGLMVWYLHAEKENRFEWLNWHPAKVAGQDVQNIVHALRIDTTIHRHFARHFKPKPLFSSEFPVVAVFWKA